MKKIFFLLFIIMFPIVIFALDNNSILKVTNNSNECSIFKDYYICSDVNSKVKSFTYINRNNLNVSKLDVPGSKVVPTNILGKYILVNSYYTIDYKAKSTILLINNNSSNIIDVIEINDNVVDIYGENDIYIIKTQDKVYRLEIDKEKFIIFELSLANPKSNFIINNEYILEYFFRNKTCLYKKNINIFNSNITFSAANLSKTGSFISVNLTDNTKYSSFYLFDIKSLTINKLVDMPTDGGIKMSINETGEIYCYGDEHKITTSLGKINSKIIKNNDIAIYYVGCIGNTLYVLSSDLSTGSPLLTLYDKDIKKIKEIKLPYNFMVNIQKIIYYDNLYIDIIFINNIIYRLYY